VTVLTDMVAVEDVVRTYGSGRTATRALRGVSFTVQPGQPGSHRNRGWERVTEQAIRALVARRAPLVAVLWGRDAGTLRPLLEGVRCVVSAHPSPMSADRGFFGSRPFSRCNDLLDEQGAPSIDWKLP